MPETTPSSVELNQQQVVGNFISSRLSQYHAAFADPPLHHDPMSGLYVPNNQMMVPRPNQEVGYASRQQLTDTDLMTLWSAIFPASMDRFKADAKEPKGRAGTEFSIRDKDSWDEIYTVLVSARSKYQDEGGRVGWLRNICRKGADNVAPIAASAKTTSKLVPNNVISTPVVGALELVLDAIKKAAEVRKQVLEGLDNLTTLFADAELFLATFPEDLNIRQASIDLTVAVLDTVEHAIGFFTRNELLRGGKAIFLASDYEADLCESLEKIQTKSANLLLEADKSHIYAARLHSKETQTILEQLLRGQQTITQGFNSLSSLLVEYMQQKRQLEAAQQQIVYLSIENGHLSMQNGILRHGQRTPSPEPQHLLPSTENYINQSTLYEMLSPYDSIDLEDLSYIREHKARLPARQLSQAEQAINTVLFRNWITSASSSRLLVQWNDTRPNSSSISPLSVFCATLISNLRFSPPGSNFISATWFCSLHIDPAIHSHIGGRAMLISIIQQILRQHTFDTRGLNSVYPQASISELLGLLEALVQRLPQTVTLYFITDGAVFYERDEVCDEATQVLVGLIRIVCSGGSQATVKLLLSSMPGTSDVRGAFEDDGLILEVAGLARTVAEGMNEERVGRAWREGGQ
ncbi:hypothetical protein QBC44DRAFT_391456 [Cladorrhinum sp. PSN332]|nr:hypothetical protein QBC44DRAFT_391456 [Cladorrhinum sp. PSN332]